MMYRFYSAVRSFPLFASTSAARYFSHHSKPTGLERSVGRKVLPPEFSRNVVRLACESTAGGGVSDVYLVGSIHGYPKTLQDVKAVVNFVKPQVTTWRLGPISIELTSLWRDESECRVAFAEANKFGSKIIFGDRHQDITIRRYGDKKARMPFWFMVKRGYSILFETKKVPNLDDRYNGPFLPPEEVCPDDPIFAEIFIDERDRYMSAKLLEVAREHNSVVAVVGKAHVLGIQKYWKQPIEVEKLLSRPVVGRDRVILGVLSILFIAACFLQYWILKFYWLLYLSSLEDSEEEK